jgi:hypothetical protein
MNQTEPQIDKRSTELLLREYELYVEMVDRTSARRVDASKLYISLLTGLLAVISFIIEFSAPARIQKIVLISIGFLGFGLCGVWFLNIRSYRQLNHLKFKVVHEIEEKLPFACYTREWEILREQEDVLSYLRLSKIERGIPILLAIPFLILLVYTVFLW